MSKIFFSMVYQCWDHFYLESIGFPATKLRYWLLKRRRENRITLSNQGSPSLPKLISSCGIPPPLSDYNEKEMEHGQANQTDVNISRPNSIIIKLKVPKKDQAADKSIFAHASSSIQGCILNSNHDHNEEAEYDCVVP